MCLDHYVAALAAIARVSITVRAFQGDVLQLVASPAPATLGRAA